MTARSGGLRLFVAIWPPLDVIEALDEFLAPRRSHSDVWWAASESFHITLAFCEHVNPDRVDRLGELLAEASIVSPFTLRLLGAGAFPHVGRAKVLWQGVDDPSGSLDPLARRVRGAANHAGAQPDGAAFAAHLTVARSRGVEATKWLRVLSAFTSREWTADEMHLVASYRGQGPRGRSRYEVVQSFGFSGPSQSPETPARP